LKHRLSNDALKQLFTEARSVNNFLAEPIAQSTILELYELLKWGPTSMNAQPARFIFLHSEASKARLLPSMAAMNVEKTRTAPLTVIVAYDTRFYEHLITQFPAYDARPMFDSAPVLAQETAFRNGSLQGAYLIAAARSLGLDCGPMNGFDAAKVDAEFFSGKSWKTNFIVNLGYGDPAGVYPRGPRMQFEQVAEIL